MDEVVGLVTRDHERSFSSVYGPVSTRGRAGVIRCKLHRASNFVEPHHISASSGDDCLGLFRNALLLPLSSRRSGWLVAHVSTQNVTQA